MNLENYDSFFIEKIKDYVVKERMPINTIINLTNNCNFNCLHCYVQSQKNIDDHSLSVKEWKQIVDELKKRGCLYITFTGGEVLTSKKFVEIYEYAYALNFRITVMTNLSLLQEKHIQMFIKKLPYEITVTLYGSSNETYEKFCGKKNGWDIVKNNIILLKNNKIPFKVQTILNTINYSEIKTMKNFLDENGISFRVYRKMKSEIDGNNRPLLYQISVEQEIESYNIIGDKQQYKEIIKKNRQKWENGYKQCFAGLTNCYIDCGGNLFLCNQSCDFKFNILDYGFDVAWEKIYHIRRQEIELINKCGKCANREICGKCTPSFEKMRYTTECCMADCNRVKKIKKYLEDEE